MPLVEELRAIEARADRAAGCVALWDIAEFSPPEVRGADPGGGRPDQADIAGALRTLKRRLYPSQRDGGRRFLAARRLVLADGMGLAKTAQATAYVLFRTGKVRRGPLIVPVSLKDQWLRETECPPTRSARKAVDHSLVLCKPSDRRPDRPVALVHI